MTLHRQVVPPHGSHRHAQPHTGVPVGDRARPSLLPARLQAQTPFQQRPVRLDAVAAGVRQQLPDGTAVAQAPGLGGAQVTEGMAAGAGRPSTAGTTRVPGDQPGAGQSGRPSWLAARLGNGREGLGIQGTSCTHVVVALQSSSAGGATREAGPEPSLPGRTSRMRTLFAQSTHNGIACRPRTAPGRRSDSSKACPHAVVQSVAESQGTRRERPSDVERRRVRSVLGFAAGGGGADHGAGALGDGRATDLDIFQGPAAQSRRDRTVVPRGLLDHGRDQCEVGP